MAERLEMAAVKKCNHTDAADDIDWCVFKMNCLCQRQFVKYYPTNLNCRLGVVVGQIVHLVELYLLSPVEICSSTCSVNKAGGKRL